MIQINKMNNLPIIYQTKTFTKAEILVIEASKMPKLKDIKPLSVKEKLTAIMINAINALGQNPREQTTVIAAIISDITTNPNLQNLSIEDIQNSITGGLRGHTATEIVMLNVLTVNKLIGAYFGLKMRIMAEYNKEAERLKKAEQEANERKSLPERAKEAYERLIKFLEEKKTIPAVGSYPIVFLELERLGKIIMDIPEKIRFANEVKQELNASADILRIKGFMNEHRQAIRDLNTPEFITDECRRRLVIQWAETYIKTITL